MTDLLLALALISAPPAIGSVYIGPDSIPAHVRREADSLWSLPRVDVYAAFRPTATGDMLDPPALSTRGDTLIVRTFASPSVAHVTYSPGWRRYVEVARWPQSAVAACCGRVIHRDPELFRYYYPRIRAEALQAARWRSWGWGEQHGWSALPPGPYRARVCARVPVEVAGQVAWRDTCGYWSEWRTVR